MDRITRLNRPDERKKKEKSNVTLYHMGEKEVMDGGGEREKRMVFSLLAGEGYPFGRALMRKGNGLRVLLRRRRGGRNTIMGRGKKREQGMSLVGGGGTSSITS